MHSLEEEFRKLNVSPSTQRKNESNTPETSDRNTTASSPSHLDLFIRDLNERKGKLPCCQEVTEIQTSVERFLKVLLRKRAAILQNLLKVEVSTRERKSENPTSSTILFSWIISLVLRTFALRSYHISW